MEEKFYIIDGNAKEHLMLKDCLTVSHFAALKKIYKVHFHDVDKNVSREEMIETLEKTILGDIKEMYRIMLYNQEGDSLRKFLLSHPPTSMEYGYLFAFREKGKVTYVIPKEFDDIYIESKKLNGEFSCEILASFLSFYILVNGFVPKTFPQSLVKKYQLNLDGVGIRSAVQLLGWSEFQDYYYDKDLIDENVDVDTLIQLKKVLSYLILDKEKLEETFQNLSNYALSLANILNVDLENLIIHLFKNFSMPLSVSQLVENIKSIYKMSSVQEKKLTKMLEEKKDDFRYWIYNGRTLSEMQSYEFVSDITMNCKPKQNSLEKCLESMNKDALNRISSYYDLSNQTISLLNLKILESAKKYVDNLELEDIKNLLNSHEKFYDYSIKDELFQMGYVFSYLDKDEMKVFLPDEIKSILSSKKQELEKKERHGFTDDIYDLSVLISEYLRMNGVIENKVLQKMLKEHHGYNLSIKKLNDFVKDMDFTICDNYYSIFEKLSKKDLSGLIKLKNEYEEYKVYTEEVTQENDLFDDSIIDFCKRLNYLSQESQQRLHSRLRAAVRQGIMDEYDLSDIINDLHVRLNSKDKKNLFHIIEKYKNIASIWTKNGFSLRELKKQTTVVSNKVGRNEPCPCGSGKKYKQCCGK